MSEETELLKEIKELLEDIFGEIADINDMLTEDRQKELGKEASNEDKEMEFPE